MKRTNLIALIIGALLSATAWGDCVDDAAAFHHVNARLLRAIAVVESHLRPAATNVNADGSTDIGLMQINSAWLPRLARYGVTRVALYDGCTNAYIGAWILAQNIARLGLTWNAVGAYNAATPIRRISYARRIYRQLMTDASGSQLSPARTVSPRKARVNDHSRGGSSDADWQASE